MQSASLQIGMVLKMVGYVVEFSAWELRCRIIIGRRFVFAILKFVEIGIRYGRTMHLKWMAMHFHGIGMMFEAIYALKADGIGIFLIIRFEKVRKVGLHSELIRHSC